MRHLKHATFGHAAITLLSSWVLCSPSLSYAQDFDFAAYEPTNLQSLISHWNKVTESYKPGISILTPPRRIRIDVVAIAEPASCSTKALQLAFKTLGMQDTLERVPITHCVRIGSDESGASISAYIQDTLVKPYREEVRKGSKVRLYTFFSAFIVEAERSSNAPMLVISDFTAP